MNNIVHKHGQTLYRSPTFLASLCGSLIDSPSEKKMLLLFFELQAIMIWNGNMCPMRIGYLGIILWVQYIFLFVNGKTWRSGRMTAMMIMSSLEILPPVVASYI